MKRLFFASNLILVSLFFSSVTLNEVNAQTRSGSVSDVQNNQRTRSQPTPQNKDEQRGFKKENLRFGGNFGAAFGPITYVDISPMVGYQFTRRFQAGMGLIYNYYAENIPPYPRLSMHIFGVNPYAQFSVVQLPSFHLFLRGEYMLLNENINFGIYDFVAGAYLEPKRGFVHYPMIGGGVLLPVGQNGGISIQLMWDLIEKERSIYGSNPILRMGIMLGL